MGEDSSGGAPRTRYENALRARRASRFEPPMRGRTAYPIDDYSKPMDTPAGQDEVGAQHGGNWQGPGLAGRDRFEPYQVHSKERQFANDYLDHLYSEWTNGKMHPDVARELMPIFEALSASQTRRGKDYRDF
jgi:hypothetical protein